VANIWQAVRRVWYRHDPQGAEWVVTPQELWRRLASDDAQGDCDDIATLAAALGRANGLPARLLLYTNGRTGYHMAAELNAGQWVAVDPVAGDVLNSRPDTRHKVQGSMPGFYVEGPAQDVAGALTGVGFTPAVQSMLAQTVANAAMSGPDPATMPAPAPAPTNAPGDILGSLTGLVDSLGGLVERGGAVYQRYQSLFNSQDAGGYTPLVPRVTVPVAAPQATKTQLVAVPASQTTPAPAVPAWAWPVGLGILALALMKRK